MDIETLTQNLLRYKESDPEKFKLITEIMFLKIELQNWKDHAIQIRKIALELVDNCQLPPQPST